MMLDDYIKMLGRQDDERLRLIRQHDSAQDVEYKIATYRRIKKLEEEIETTKRIIEQLQ